MNLLFHRRYCVPWAIFNHIIDDTSLYDKYFASSIDATGKCGISSINKFTAAFIC